MSGWIVRPPSFHSQELTELCATLYAVEIRGDSEVQGNAPQTEFRQNAASYLQLQGGKQILPGAAGFWASRELPVCCVSRLCFLHSCVFAFVLDDIINTYTHTHTYIYT